MNTFLEMAKRLPRNPDLVIGVRTFQSGHMIIWRDGCPQVIEKLPEATTPTSLPSAPPAPS